MFIIEFLAVDWKQPDKSTVLKTIEVNSTSPSDLNRSAWQKMADIPSCDGYLIKDGFGQTLSVYRERNYGPSKS